MQATASSAMSYKIEIIDEYSFGQWFSHHLRFETEAQAEECSRHFGASEEKCLKP